MKRHKHQKAVPIVVTPSMYGPAFMAWWRVIQPAWRCMKIDTLSMVSHEMETWAMLAKGGTSGFYTIVVALSWWIQVVSVIDDADPNTANIGLYFL